MIRCPICKKEVTLGSPEFPFCSERCRIIDLGNWSSEKYKIPSAHPPGSSADSEEEDE
jgi:endogenous inhibitor of DNA gyrase (YacG/DUF329 family)